MKLQDIKGIGQKVEQKLNQLGIFTPLDLLNTLPSKYIDLKSPVSVLNAENGLFSLFSGEVESLSQIKGYKVKSFAVKFCDTLATKKVHFKAVFYNQPYLYDKIKVGVTYRLLGKITWIDGGLALVNPQIEVASDVKKLHDGIFTLYPLRGVMGQNTFKNLMRSAVDLFGRINYFESSAYSNALASSVGIVPFLDGVEQAQFPLTQQDALAGQMRLAVEDLANAISFYRIFNKNAHIKRKVFYKSQYFGIDEFKTAINITPTASQIKAFEDVTADLASDYVMRRMVNGDVGSGKTLVAFFALAIAAKNGLQSALMAPTEILARQHAANFAPIAVKLGINFACLTSSTSSSERTDILRGLKAGRIQVVFGTQSLIGADVKYNALSLIVIDEQHKFGVTERKKLEEKGIVDTLSMSATPIPRTLFLTMYDNIAISNIQKRAEATSNITTRIVREDKKEDMLAYLATECKKGKQAFIVCPSIFDSEGYDLYSAEELYKQTKDTVFGGLSVALIHGKMSAETKNTVMRDFTAGKISILIATTVIEVGIDTKASLLAVLNADRFGLASLHQLRGRIGRDGSEAFCFLHTAKATEGGVERLSSLVHTSDGLALAEKDFEMRGAGDFLGTRQCGAQSTPKYSLPIDISVLKQAKTLSDAAIAENNPLTIQSLNARASNYADFMDKLFDTTLSS